jgi:DNA polymerase III delta prime subunit
MNIAAVNQTLPPAQLLVGPSAATRRSAITIIQRALCTTGCGICRLCKQIAEQRSFHLLWLSPEKQYYTKAELEAIAHRLSFALEDNETFFIILNSVDLLPPAAGNSLLKMLEEPPRGYHFLLLTERRMLVMPTIISRCVEFSCHDESSGTQHEEVIGLLRQPHFNRLKKIAQYDFAALSHEDTLLLLDKLIIELRQSDHAHRTLPIILSAYAQLPMPGSSKLFWRSLALSLALVEENNTYSTMPGRSLPSL